MCGGTNPKLIMRPCLKPCQENAKVKGTAMAVWVLASDEGAHERARKGDAPTTYRPPIAPECDRRALAALALPAGGLGGSRE